MNKKILITLCVSLALNFFFLGFGASRLMYRPEPTRFADFGKTPAFDGMKKEFLKPSKKEKKAFRKKMKEIDGYHKKIAKAFAADPFDEEGARDAWNKASAVRSSMDADMRDAVIGKMKNMPADERARLSREFTGFFGKKHHGRHMPGCSRRDGAFTIDAPFARAEGRCHGKPERRAPEGVFEQRPFAPKPCGCRHDKPCGCQKHADPSAPDAEAPVPPAEPAVIDNPPAE